MQCGCCVGVGFGVGSGKRSVLGSSAKAARGWVTRDRAVESMADPGDVEIPLTCCRTDPRLHSAQLRQ